MWTWRTDSRQRVCFETNLLPHLGALYRFARALGTPAKAEDLVQTTCARALERFDTYQPGTNLRAWLFTILRHELVSEHRRFRRERELESTWVSPFSESAEAPSLEAMLIEQRWSDEVRAALAALPETYRTPVYLKDVEGFRYREIALVVGCPLGTTMSRLARGRALLRAALVRQAAERGLVGIERRKESV